MNELPPKKKKKKKKQKMEKKCSLVQMALKDQSFVNRFKVSFVCIPEDVWPSDFGKGLKMPQR